MTGPERIEAAISRARSRRDARAHLDQLIADKEELLAEGMTIILTSDDEKRHRWFTEYNAICRLIHEDQAELRSHAA